MNEDKQEMRRSLSIKGFAEEKDQPSSRLKREVPSYLLSCPFNLSLNSESKCVGGQQNEVKLLMVFR